MAGHFHLREPDVTGGRHHFVVCVDSTREIDLEGRRIRRLEGVNAPTQREGDHRWTRYDHLRPDPPVGGTPLTIVWEVVGDLWRSTVTSEVVGSFWVDPTAGPYAWAGGPESAEESTLGLVVVDGTGLVTPTACAAHVVCSLANAGVAHDGFSSPEPLWQLLPVADRGGGPLAAVGVGGVETAVGDRRAVELLHWSLLRLPPDVNLPVGALAAAQATGWPTPVPITAAPTGIQRRALAAAGLTELEIDSVPDLAVLVEAVGELAEFMPMGSVGRWLRARHPAVDDATPLGVLAACGELGPALSTPFPEGIPQGEWEPRPSVATAPRSKPGGPGGRSVETRRTAGGSSEGRTRG